MPTRARRPLCWLGYTEWVEQHYGVEHWWQAPEEATARIYGDGNPDAPFNQATCLLPAGHEEPHEWTPDGEILITFPPGEVVH